MRATSTTGAEPPSNVFAANNQYGAANGRESPLERRLKDRLLWTR